MALRADRKIHLKEGITMMRTKQGMKIGVVGMMALALLMMGCGMGGRVMTTTSEQFTPTNPDAVKIYQTDKPTTPFKEIGRVSVAKYSNPVFPTPRSGDAMYKDLRKKAASIGGDAIINITEDMVTMSGVVIKMLPEKK